MKNNEGDTYIVDADFEKLHGLDEKSILIKMLGKRQRDIEYIAKKLTQLQSILQDFASGKLKGLNVNGKEIKPTKNALLEYAAFMLQETMNGANIEVNHTCTREDGTWSCAVPEIKYDDYTIQSPIFDKKIEKTNESE